MSVENKSAQQLAEDYNLDIFGELLDTISAGEYDFEWLDEFLEVGIDDERREARLLITTGGPHTELIVYNSGQGKLVTHWGSGRHTIYCGNLEDFFEWLLEWLL